ncbi:alanine--glyoxylate aminotransferase family protein [Motiliproteus coralliicola]|uniref:Alanine--glyoxylate aminotransferase family protein n=1 Tax=Motiliproteus coralliicola TaxID=2283196 RepID=A0A369WFE7_9GAMM|nr:aminotransferase class V-fold PLP-dependent enzyme [Motiliproteus coralliicola]RDE19374.1 alanine--glyoxylate aminotransferase family protein [Motiliproteus coralliicola]
MPKDSCSADNKGLLEYSVVYTDRSLNHMSVAFQDVMKGISTTLKSVYNAHSVAVVPGSGTFGMEAVARQFATDKHCLVIRNGWFSFRWSQIFDAGKIPQSHTVLKARQTDSSVNAPFAPAPIDEVVAKIREEKPSLVFAPHVETASGMMLPDDYLRAVADAVHEVGGMFVLDCIASGTIWVDMEATGVDVLLSAPQKGWSGSPCCALVMLSPLARDRIDNTQSSSFACDLKKWLQIMETYEQGGHAYHATMPTDGLAKFYQVMKETEQFGFETVRKRQLELGEKVRELLVQNGFASVAAEGFQAPGVVVSYTSDSGISNGSKFAVRGVQIAAGVPLQCDEPEGFQTFRIGLFGLDKLHDVDCAAATFGRALNRILLDYKHI